MAMFTSDRLARGLHGRLLGGVRLSNLDDLALDVDLDLVADDELAVEHDVEVHAEVLPVDAGLRGIADPVAHPVVTELSIPDDIERHRPGRGFDGEVAGHAVAVTPECLDLRALEVHRRVPVDLE